MNDDAQSRTGVLGGGGWSPPAGVLARMHLDSMHVSFLKRYLPALGHAAGDGVVRVRAYGSRVRGNVRPDSDLDLLVTVRGGVDRRLPGDVSFQVGMDMSDEHPSLFALVDVMTFEHDHWLSQLREGQLFPHVVEDEGVDLYFSPSLSADAYTGVGVPPGITMVYDLP